MAMWNIQNKCEKQRDQWTHQSFRGANKGQAEFHFLTEELKLSHNLFLVYFGDVSTRQTDVIVLI